MTAPRGLPAEDRPGKHGWLGPISLCLGLLSWLLPVGGMPLALGAVTCGVISMTTLTEYRLDWTAVVGTGVGSAQTLLSLVLVAMTFRGH